MRSKGVFLAFFSRALASLLSAGVPLLPALQGLARQQERLRERKIVEKLAADVACGFSLSEAMERAPGVFSGFITGLVQVGEQTGALAQTMEKVAAYLENSRKVRFRLFSALTYPCVLLGVTMTGTVLLIKVFVPAFEPIFLGMSHGLPPVTRLLLQLSALLSSWVFWTMACGAGGVLFLLHRAGMKDAQMRQEQDALFLKLPLVGEILKKGILAQMTSTIAAACSSGLTLARGLELVVGVVENEVFKDFIQDSRLALARGEKLSDFFLGRREYVFPLVGHMMAVAENTGEVEALMSRCARILEEEMDFAIQQFATLLEPGALIFLGVIVSFILTGVFVPLYQMLQEVR